jgi:type I restriction enzyme S subunit
MLNNNAGWPLKPLSEVVDLNPRLDKSVYRDDLEVSFVPMAAVQAGSGRMEVSKTKHFSTVKKGYTPFKENDVLFAKITPCMENGKMGVVPKLTNGLGFGSTEFHVLRPNEGIDPHYVYYFVSSEDFRREAAHRMTGAVGQKRVPQSFLEESLIPVPLFDDQKSIVAEIEKQFSRLDEAVANLKRVKSNLERYKASVLKAAVEGKLTEDWRKQYPDVEPASKLLERILAERRVKWNGRGKYKEPVKPDTNILSTLPSGWVWASPDQLAQMDGNAICAGPFGTIFKAKDFRPVGVPIIFLRHVAPGKYLRHKPGFMDEQKWRELFQPYSVFGGELLVTKLGEPPGVCAIYPSGIGPAMVTPDVIKISVNSAAILTKFFMHYMNSNIARRFATGVAFGTTRQRVTLPIFREMPVPLPPLSEQRQIVAEVERRLSVIEEIEATVEANLARADRLRQSVLARAFSGQLACRVGVG